GGGVRHPDSRRPGREDQDGRRGDRLHRERGQEQATTAVVSSMTRRRAVITGLGTVNPLALNVPDYWRALLAGRSGIAPLTLFDVSAFKVRFGGEVKNFAPETVIDGRAARRMDRFTQFAMAAAAEAVKDSGLD